MKILALHTFIDTNSFALNRESIALNRESFALIRISFALIRESNGLIREKYNFFPYENEPNWLSYYSATHS